MASFRATLLASSRRRPSCCCRATSPSSRSGPSSRLPWRACRAALPSSSARSAITSLCSTASCRSSVAWDAASRIFPPSRGASACKPASGPAGACSRKATPSCVTLSRWRTWSVRRPGPRSNGRHCREPATSRASRSCTETLAKRPCPCPSAWPVLSSRGPWSDSVHGVFEALRVASTETIAHASRKLTQPEALRVRPL